MLHITISYMLQCMCYIYLFILIFRFYVYYWYAELPTKGRKKICFTHVLCMFSQWFDMIRPVPSQLSFSFFTHSIIFFSAQIKISCWLFILLSLLLFFLLLNFFWVDCIRKLFKCFSMQDVLRTPSKGLKKQDIPNKKKVKNYNQPEEICGWKFLVKKRR